MSARLSIDDARCARRNGRTPEDLEIASHRIGAAGASSAGARRRGCRPGVGGV